MTSITAAAKKITITQKYHALREKLKRYSFKEIIFITIYKLFIPINTGLAFICTSFLLVFFFIIRPLKKIQIGFLICSRIGHLAQNTEKFLREFQTGESRNDVKYILFCHPSIIQHRMVKIANKQLFVMMRRALEKHCVSVIENPVLNRLVLPSLIKRTKYYKNIDENMHSNEYELYQKSHKSTWFTDAEMERGRRALAQFGLTPEDWFVCFFARDSLYLKKEFPRAEYSYHDCRDCDIATYEMAARFILDRGGYIFRLGRHVKKKMSFSHERLIDYPYSPYQSDFMDMFLCGNCRFIMGTSSGIIDAAVVMDTPYAAVNMVPVERAFWTKDTLFIPKKVKNINNGEYLPLQQHIQLMKDMMKKYNKKYEYFEQHYMNILTENGFCLEDNSQEEILYLTKEMFEQLEGSFIQSPEDAENIERYHQIHSLSIKYSQVKAPVGKDFLKKNQWYIS